MKFANKALGETSWKNNKFGVYTDINDIEIVQLDEEHNEVTE